MNNIIELFRKELIEIACLKDTTVRLYVDIIYMYFDYRQTIYEVSSQTTRSNLIDLNLFKDYLKKQKCNRITGETVMGFRMYLKKKRLNTGSSINRKLFSLRSYGSYLQTLELDGQTIGTAKCHKRCKKQSSRQG